MAVLDNVTIWEGTEGTDIRINCQEDISSATGLKMEIKRPDGTLLEVASILYGTNYMEYIIPDKPVEVDPTYPLTAFGRYSIMAYAKIGSWKGYGKPVTIEYVERHKTAIV